MKYRKKPVVIDAFKLGTDEVPYWFDVAVLDKVIDPVMIPDGDSLVLIYTLEGTMVANEGDYVIRGVKGEIYPCKPDIFEMTYEEVE